MMIFLYTYVWISYDPSVLIISLSQPSGQLSQKGISSLGKAEIILENLLHIILEFKM